MSQYNPATCDVTDARVISYGDDAKFVQIKDMISNFEITQSMFSTVYTGSLIIFDTIGLLETFPLRGEESLKLKFKSYDLETIVSIDAKIRRIDSIQASPSNNGLQYKIHFVSALSFDAGKRIVTKAYNGKVHDIAKGLFQTYFSGFKKQAKIETFEYDTERYTLDKDDTLGLFVQKTGNNIRTIIPRYSPMYAMKHLASQAYLREGSSNTFRFFETIENFYFATDDFFIKDAAANSKEIRKFHYSPTGTATADSPESQINRIDSMSISSKGINSGDDITNGSYRNKVVELDLVRRKVDILNFDYTKDAKYIDMSGSPRNLEDKPYTDDFIKDTFTDENARRFLIFKDYSGPGDSYSPSVNSDRFISQIIANRVSYYHHLNSTQVTASLKGRFDLRPGQIIHIDISNIDGVNQTKFANDTLSGRYLIQATNHSRGTDNVLNTTLQLAKFDWSKG